jgi:glycosyltransferase involved in cell wall biosynthesis
MKICLISNLYPPFVRGGAERVAEIMARGLFDSGHDVVVISTKPNKRLDIEAGERYKVYRFKPMNLFYYLDDFRHSTLARFFWRLFDIFNLHGAFVVARILQKERPGIVITHNLTGIGFLIPSVIRAFKIRHCHILHDVQLFAASGIILKGAENGLLTNGWLARIFGRLCDILFGSPDLVISPSRWLMNYYVSNGFFRKSGQIVQSNPVRTVKALGGDRMARRNKFLFAGQLKPHKGIDWLVNLWEKNEIEDELIVVGAGDYQIACNKVRFAGALDEPGLNKIFVQADFLIVPSLCYENSPSVIQLAFANGVPVIVADIGGAAELVEPGKSGFIFTAGSEIEFLNALKQAKRISFGEWKVMSDYCRKKAMAFSVNNYITQLISKILNH